MFKKDFTAILLAVWAAMIHVVMSEGARRALQRAALPGDIIVWGDRLEEGPVPSGANISEWLRTRAAYLEAETDRQVESHEALQILEVAISALEQAIAKDEVVFWADAGLADQLGFVFFLNHLLHAGAITARHTFVSSTERAGGRLCSLSDLIPSQVHALFQSRRRLSEPVMTLGDRVWKAFCDSEPDALWKLLEEDLSPLPHIKAALVRHFQQYPDTARGLSRLEYEALAIVAMGYSKLVEIFVHVDQHEDRPHFTDVVLWRCLNRMAREKNPLVTVSGKDPLPLWKSPRRLLDWTIWITDAGLDVLHGDKDRVHLNGFERQLGGVRFHGARAKWRWDSARGMLVSSEHAN